MRKCSKSIETGMWLKDLFCEMCFDIISLSSNITHLVFKGIVHLNIIFSCIKFNRICNVDHPVY